MEEVEGEWMGLDGVGSGWRRGGARDGGGRRQKRKEERSYHDIVDMMGRLSNWTEGCCSGDSQRPFFIVASANQQSDLNNTKIRHKKQVETRGRRRGCRCNKRYSD